MLKALAEIDWNKIIAPLATLVIGGVVTWTGITIRKAIKNYGKTDLEIAQEQYDNAMKDVEAAAKTPETTDDAEKQRLAAAAKKHLDDVKRWKSITDAIGATDAVGADTEKPSE